MGLKYYATNKIPINSNEERDKYLNLLFWYFSPPNRTLPLSFENKILDERKKLDNIILFEEVPGQLFKQAKLDPSKSLNGFNLTYVGNVGFVEYIFYDENNRCFKLCIFYDEILEKNGLDILFEPMRKQLESGPKSVGLSVIKEHQDLIVTLDFENPIQKAKIDFRRYLEEEIKYYKELANIEIKKVNPETCSYEELEENFRNREEKDWAQNILWKLVIKKDFLPKQGYKEKLRRTAELFKRIRDEFSARFLDKEPVFSGTAYGTFPHMHDINEAIACWGYTKEFLPAYKGTPPTSLLDAEIYAKPEGECKRIISIYPYVSIFPELNEWYEEFLEDEDLMTALLAREFAHIYHEDKMKSIDIERGKSMLVPWYCSSKIDEYKAVSKEHEAIDRFLYKIGYGEENKRMLKWYKDKYRKLLDIYKRDFDNRLIL